MRNHQRSLSKSPCPELRAQAYSDIQASPSKNNPREVKNPQLSTYSSIYQRKETRSITPKPKTQQESVSSVHNSKDDNPKTNNLLGQPASQPQFSSKTRGSASQTLPSISSKSKFDRVNQQLNFHEQTAPFNTQANSLAFSEAIRRKRQEAGLSSEETSEGSSEIKRSISKQPCSLFSPSRNPTKIFQISKFKKTPVVLSPKTIAINVSPEEEGSLTFNSSDSHCLDSNYTQKGQRQKVKSVLAQSSFDVVYDPEGLPVVIRKRSTTPGKQVTFSKKPATLCFV